MTIPRVILIPCALSIIWPNIAYAQANDEVIVTTQKRSQNIQDVPLAISAFSSDNLAVLGVEQFDDLANFVPGLEVQEQSANNPGFVIRGITSDSGEATIEPRISIFQDGVSISRSRGSFVEIMDSQVEVVRGPQPTLFGRSALIGAITVNSNKPDLTDASGKFRIGTGNFDMFTIEGVANIPITSENAAARAVMRYKKREGYVENLLGENLNGYKTLAGRVSVRLKPVETLDVTLIASHQSDNNSGTAFKSGTFFADPSQSTSPFEPAALSTFGDLHDGRELGVDRNITSLTSLVDYTINDAFSLSSITNYREFDSFEVYDPDGFAYELFSFAEDAVSEQFSQELRLNFDLYNKFSGFIGGSYFSEDGAQTISIGISEPIAQALLGGFLFTNSPGVSQTPPPLNTLPTVNINPANPLFGAPLGVHIEDSANFGKTNSWDFFADASYAVTDRLELTAGLRYTADDKYSASAVSADAPSNFTGVGIFLGTGIATNGRRIETSDNFDGVTWRIAANYEVSDAVNIFANYARGRRPDVISYNLDPNDLTVFATGELSDNFERLKAENVSAYEIGLKGLFFDGTLYSDLSAYLYDYTNFQSTIIDSGSGQIVPINAGNASAIGVENSNRLNLNDKLSFFSLYAFTDATFDKTNNAGNTQIFGGNRFRLTPKHAFTIGAEISQPFWKGNIVFMPVYAWKSKVFFDNDNDLDDGVQDEFQPSYGLLDLRLSYSSNASNWTVQAFSKNTLNKNYLLDAGNVGGIFGIPTFIAAPPRTYGLSFSTSF